MNAEWSFEGAIESCRFTINYEKTIIPPLVRCLQTRLFTLVVFRLIEEDCAEHRIPLPHLNLTKVFSMLMFQHIAVRQQLRLAYLGIEQGSSSLAVLPDFLLRHEHVRLEQLSVVAVLGALPLCEQSLPVQLDGI